MTIVLINPNLVVQRNDLFTTGVVYMPIGLAYIAASLRQAAIPISVIDAFGEAPRRPRHEGKFMILGLTSTEVVEHLPHDVAVVFIYANQLINHNSLTAIVKAIKKVHPLLPVVILENTQAVTAYALRPIAPLLFESGADYLLSGEGEQRAVLVANALINNADKDLSVINGLSSRQFNNPIGEFIEDLDTLPFPAWDLFPVENYWKLRFAHGPLSQSRYLPLLTSRGCPYPCKFCVVPATNKRSWRARSAQNVVDEMEFYLHHFGVQEFHIEDLNPTINDKRTRAICQEIIHRRLKVIWKIAAGTKAESIKDEETIELMAKAGCRYISISPESGSSRVMTLIDKPFKLYHATRLIKRMNEVGIRSQACFVLGFPGEQAEDLEMTHNLVKEMTMIGVDEIALFIISPVPGAEIFESLKGYQSLSDLNFTPTWRADYPGLSRFRLQLYRSFLWWKIRYHPLKILHQMINFLRRRFETKMEMVPYKAISLKMLMLMKF